MDELKSFEKCPKYIDDLYNFIGSLEEFTSVIPEKLFSKKVQNWAYLSQPDLSYSVVFTVEKTRLKVLL